MRTESKDIMTKQDIDLLLAGFPDLKDEKDFPTEPTSASVIDFVSGYMEKCGVKSRPSEMLEYLAVAASMKAVAQASLGKLDGEAYKQLSLSHPEAKEALSKIANGQDGGISTVHQDVRESISNMDFKTVAAMYPIQAFMHKNMESELGKINLDDKSLQRVFAIPELGGNETGNRDYEHGEFVKTAGRRVFLSIENGLFDCYACQHLLSNAMQIRAALDLGKSFPQMSESIKKNKEFFTTHAVESIAVCHAVNEGKQRVNKFDVLRDMVAAPETRDFAYVDYAKVFQVYASQIDPETGKCLLAYGDNKNPGEISMPRDLSQTENGDKFMDSIQKQAAQSFGDNNRFMAISNERLKA